LVAVSQVASSSTLHPILEFTAKLVVPDSELTLWLFGLTSKVAAEPDWVTVTVSSSPVP
jgi:hypothetical protein